MKVGTKDIEKKENQNVTFRCFCNYSFEVQTRFKKLVCGL